ncbi:CCR4-NOT transcription complex subunit 6-like isoform X3 [Lasioglossum baleicum]|uniref:CCR4-NOT transcription complex subunit 6-like isoform X3 n=1 Tax=Lasioglossum baleicum TaxID=434251 RepID=UPI003FCCE7B9
MSRNHKDKYENSNPRRTHTFMSTEDANSGKKSYWPELEITGSIRNLSPNLWQLTHLTALYLNDNSLQRIPAEIGRMANLRALDLSSNKLRSLPAELGDLIYLRELLLNQNYLRVLPYELGKLFQLKVLGLQGNPLSKEVMALYGEPSGTSKLLSYMLDNLQDVAWVRRLIRSDGLIDVCNRRHATILPRQARSSAIDLHPSRIIVFPCESRPGYVLFFITDHHAEVFRNRPDTQEVGGVSKIRKTFEFARKVCVYSQFNCTLCKILLSYMV